MSPSGWTVAAAALLAALGGAPEGRAQLPRVPPSPPPSPALEASTPERLGATTRFLADSLLAGRVPGSPGGMVAARFLMAEFEAVGLTATLQPVPLLAVRAEPSMVLAAGRETFALRASQDYVAWPETADSLTSIDGEVIFVGYGIEAPEWGWDDYKGVPQTGRIVMVLAGDPGLRDSTVFRGRSRTPYGDPSAKIRLAGKLDAAGVLFVHSPEAGDAAWSDVAAAGSGERIRLERDTASSVRVLSWIREEVARRLLQAAGRDFDLMIRRAQRPEFSPMTTGIRAAIDIDADVRKVRGANVVARLAGTDSTAEVVVVAAPYVRVGLDATFWRDTTDGSPGEVAAVAALLAAAVAAAELAPRPRRDIEFVATAGRPGAEYYIESGRRRAAAILHLEGTPRPGVVTLAADRSTLGGILTAAAQAEGLSVVSPPNPDAVLASSGTWAYLQTGIPALGLRPDGTIQTARLLLRLAWTIATSSQPPKWLPGFEPTGGLTR